MNIWDTAGQERYRSLTKHYLNGSDGIILVYDTTYSDSLGGVKEWFEDMKEKVDLSETVVALVGNKVDDIEGNQIPISQANLVKKEIGAHIFEEMSAKENIKVDDVFERMAQMLLDRHKS